MTGSRALRWLCQLMAWVAILGIAALICAAVLVPRLAGATPYTILTGSMRPHMPPGTMVVVKPIDPAEIRTGDVITYQLSSGESTVVTHRVISIGVTTTGELRFTTQGDANPQPDPAPVLPVQVRGKRWYSVQHLGHLSNLLTGQQRQTGIYLAAAGLVVYSLSMFLGTARDRRRTREPGRRSVHV